MNPSALLIFSSKLFHNMNRAFPRNLRAGRAGRFRFPDSVRESAMPMKEKPPIRQTMEVIVSLAVLVAALYIILEKSPDSGSQKWAFGIVGSILTYWLRPRR
jgi:hypothetical protein